MDPAVVPQRRTHSVVEDRARNHAACDGHQCVVRPTRTHAGRVWARTVDGQVSRSQGIGDGDIRRQAAAAMELQAVCVVVAEVVAPISVIVETARCVVAG